MDKPKSAKIRQRNLPQADRIEPPDYYFWGTVPVRFLSTKKGGMTSERLDLKTGEFVMDQAMVAEIFFNPSTSANIERVGETAFNKRVEQIRKDI